MPNITLSLSEELKRKMEEFPEVNWSGLMKKYLESRVEKLAWKDKMLKYLENEKSFEEEAIIIGNKMKRNAWEKLKKEGW
jgi:hypothetical protein